MRTKTLALMAASMLALASLPAAAGEPLSYTYFEAGYGQTHIDGLGDVLGSDHLSGYSVAAGYGHENGVLAFASYTDRDRDASYTEPDLSIRGKLEQDTFRIGLGYAFHMTQRADWVTTIAYESNTLGLSATADYLDEFGDPVHTRAAGDVEADGYTLETGFRAQLGERFNGYIGAGHTRYNDPKIGAIDIDGDVFESGEEIDLDALGADRGNSFGKAGLEFFFAGRWSLVGEAVVGEDIKNYFVGIRKSL